MTEEVFVLFGTIIMFVIINGATVFSVFHMRSTIKELKGVYPKNGLMIMHLVNFIVYSGLYITYQSLLVGAVATQDRYNQNHLEPVELRSRKIYFFCYLIWCINEFVLLFNVIFLLGLIVMFTNNQEKKEEKKDVLLDRNVDKFVVVSNQRLLKKTF